MSQSTSVMDSSLLPPLLMVGLPVAFVGYRIYRFFAGSSSGSRQAYNPSTGIGRGAPGFQTGVKRVAVPPALAARIRAGEDVSAEEVTAAIEAEKERLAQEEQAEAEKAKLPDGVDADWLPAGAADGKGKGAARRKKK
ncbi:hypothetical protein JCM8202_005905 [Rhodotorula sphaerocarpa]